MKGWIKLHRGLLDWEWWDDAESVKLFVYLLLKANHEDRKWKGETIKRGQFVTSLPSLIKDTGLSRQKIRTRLERLEMSGEITDKSTNKNRLITICNYEDYQSVEESEKQPVQQTDNSQITFKQHSNNTKQELKNYKEDKNIYIQGENKILPKSLLDAMNIMLNNQLYIERLCMNNRLLPKELEEHIKNFFVHLANRGEVYKDERDSQEHFANWLNHELRKEKQNENKRNYTKSESNGSTNSGNWTDADAEAIDMLIDGLTIGR